VSAFAQALERACRASRPQEDASQITAPLLATPGSSVAALPRLGRHTARTIFLSAAPGDEPVAARLAADLSQRGQLLSNDLSGRVPGADQEDVMRQAVRAADRIVVVVTPQTRSSRLVAEHLRLAQMYQRRLVLVWMQGEEMAGLLLDPLWHPFLPVDVVDARSSRYQAALDELLACLREERQMVSSEGTITLTTREEPRDPRNPYKGLRAFREEDALDFFGRDGLLEATVVLLKRMLAQEQKGVAGARLLTLVGPSGSGKSSVVQAGLLPRLQAGVLPGSQNWVYLDPIVPGTRPLESLALTLAPHLPDRSMKALCEDLQDDSARGLHRLCTQLAKGLDCRVVLVVDQFEELFTQMLSEEERRSFVGLLVTAVTEQAGPVLVLLTLRVDFYGYPMRYPQLYQLIEAHHQSILPMDISALRAVIEEPAALPDVQLTFEGNLVGDLLFEAQGQVGALPLLEFTLDQLFQHRDGQTLTMAAYQQIGGVKGALTKHAEATYATLPSEEHQRLARALFLRLIEPGVSEQDTTRRRASLAELSLADVKQTVILQEVAAAFVTARLLITNEVAGTTTIEVSHEALIREWPRLSDWLREGREDIQLQQAVSQDVAEWQRREKPKDRLYRGSQLKEARAWARRNTPSKDETDFLQASTLRERNVRNLSRFLIGITSVVLVGVLLVVLVLQGNLLATQGRLLASLPVSVTNTKDSGPGSLREAIKNAKDGDAITFAKTLTEPDGQDCTQCTITLTGGELEITKSITISGPSGRLLTISGQHKSRIFYVHPGAVVQIFNLVIKDGSAPKDCTWCNTDGKGGNPDFGAAGDPGVGGAIFNGLQTTLALTNVIVSGSQTGTGAIFNDGTLALIDCSVFDNKTSGILNLASATLASSIISDDAADYGGGINNWGNLTIINSTISGNRASNSGGGIYNLGIFKLANSTISGNQASGGGGGIYNNMGIYTENDMGISNGCGDGVIDYSTIYLNKATAGGGGIASNNHSCKNGLLMQASIVASNSALSGPDILGPIVLTFLNLIQDTSGAEMSYKCQDHSRPYCGMQPIVGQPPRLGPLQADKPGQPPTHALLPDSPARDRLPPDRSASREFDTSICDNSYNDFDSSRDERGVLRPQGSACDLGADEAQK
jgi:TIR domain